MRQKKYFTYNLIGNFRNTNYKKKKIPHNVNEKNIINVTVITVIQTFVIIYKTTEIFLSFTESL